jgi:hypothetical protein
MCGSAPKLPPAKDPKVEREEIAAEATASANAKAAVDRKAKRNQSLLAMGGAMGSQGQVTTSSVLAVGRSQMGSGG